MFTLSAMEKTNGHVHALGFLGLVPESFLAAEDPLCKTM